MSPYTAFTLIFLLVSANLSNKSGPIHSWNKTISKFVLDHGWGQKSRSYQINLYPFRTMSIGLLITEIWLSRNRRHGYFALKIQGQGHGITGQSHMSMVKFISSWTVADKKWVGLVKIQCIKRNLYVILHPEEPEYDMIQVMKWKSLA